MGSGDEMSQLWIRDVKDLLSGGFKYFVFSPLFGEDSHFDVHIFHMGGSTTNQFRRLAFNF